MSETQIDVVHAWDAQGTLHRAFWNGTRFVLDRAPVDEGRQLRHARVFCGPYVVELSLQRFDPLPCVLDVTDTVLRFYVSQRTLVGNYPILLQLHIVCRNGRFELDRPTILGNAHRVPIQDGTALERLFEVLHYAGPLWGDRSSTEIPAHSHESVVCNTLAPRTASALHSDIEAKYVASGRTSTGKERYVLSVTRNGATTRSGAFAGLWLPANTPFRLRTQLTEVVSSDATVRNPEHGIDLELPAAVGESLWNTQVTEPMASALRITDDPLGISLAPRLRLDDAARWSLHAAATEAELSGALAWSVGWLTLEPTRTRFELPMFADQRGKPLTVAAQIGTAQKQQQAEPGSSYLGLAFELTSCDSEACTIRLGGLDLETKGFERGTFELSPKSTTLRPRFEIKDLALWVQKVVVGAQDAAPGEHTEAALALTFDTGVTSDAPSDAQAKLIVEELAPSQAHEGHVSRVRLRLQRTTGSAPTQRILLLDRTPFFVAQVDVHDWSGDASSVDIAHYADSDTDLPRWEIRGGTDGIAIRLPPQGIGEAMEKGKPADGYFDLDEKTTEAEREKNQVAFRFTPTATLVVYPSYYKQTFAEPAWNSRRLFGHSGQRAPGAELKSASFELLYGMSATITAPLLRVAEIGARLGTVAPNVDSLAWRDRPTPEQSQAFSARAATWKVLREHASRRLGVLEPWREGTASLSLDEDVSYNLRPSAQLRYPLPYVGKDEMGNAPAAFRPSAPSDPAERNESLAGGVGWAFESRAILDAVWRKPQSVAGEISRPFFSALGGWGEQKAVFDRGLSTVYANVEMGRVSYFALERLGRIGVLWHRAKHVIVYERTVARAPRFADQQDQLAGAPILRKVREYVEILEPTRHYPDDATSSVAHTGCLVATHFKDKQIDVDSRWGRDLVVDGRAIGWEVPLWRREIFDRPHVVHELAAGPAESAPTIAVDHEDPSILYFYTDVREEVGSDVEQWPPVAEVDYPLRRDPRVPTGAAGRSDQPDAPMADPLAVPFGFERFTYAVAAGGLTSNITHGRSDGNVGVVPRNFTMLRSHESKPADAEMTPLDRIEAQLERLETLDSTQLEAALPTLQKELGARLSALVLKDTVHEQSAGVVRALEALHARLGPMGEAVSQAVARWEASPGRLTGENFVPLLGEELRTLVRSSLAPQIGLELRGFLDAGNAALAALLRLESSLHSTIDAVRDRITDAEWATRTQSASRLLQQLESQLLAPVHDAEAEINARAQSVYRVARLFSDRAENTKRALATRIAALPADWRQAVQILRDTVRDQLSPWRAEVDAFNADIAQAHLERYLGDPNELTRTLEATIQAHVQSIWDGAGNVQGALTALKQAEPLRQLLAAKLPSIPTPDQIALLVAKLQTVFGSARAQVEQFETQAKQLFERAKELSRAGDPQRALAELQRSLRRELTAVEREARTTVAAILPSRALRIPRAFGEVPKAALLDFNRSLAAYHFPVHDARVWTTPMVALVNRAGDQLKSMGLRVPTREILDQLKPDLSALDISKFLPDLAGLKLDDLFPHLELPPDVRITHGADPASRRAWVDARVDLRPPDATLFSFGPVLARVLKPRIDATLRIEVSADGRTRQISRGALRGDWELTIGGFTLVTFVDTSLTFDETGRLKFNLDPANVRFDGALAFLADRLTSTGNGDGFSVRPTLVGGAPMGVEALLDVKLPDTEGGTFGVANLRLMSSFGLRVASGPDGVDFQLSTALALGRRDAPFVLTVAILSGGGWLEVASTYSPSTQRISATVSIGLAAGARIGLSLGPISGAVYAYFGIGVEFHANARSGSSLAVSMSLLLGGQVSLGGWATVTVNLLLEGRYHQGVLTGHGFISIKVKICWCFTFKFHRRFEHTFTKKKSPSQGVHDKLRTLDAKLRSRPEYDAAHATFLLFD